MNFIQLMFATLLKIFYLAKELNVSGYGFSDDAERCLIAFSLASIDVSIFDNAAKVVKISYNDKFSKLSHRDF